MVIKIEEETGTVSQEDIDAYASVVDRAFGVHVDRERIRQGLWKQYDASDQTRQIKIKADRVDHSMDRRVKADGATAEALSKSVIEELYDVINYSIFAIRQLEGTA